MGPNNVGKTNLLKSVELFFTGYENRLGYARAVDLTFGAGTAQTSLRATFLLSEIGKDPDIAALLDDLHAMVGTTREGDRFSINLYFTGTNTPVYRVFGNTPVVRQADKATFSRRQKQLVETVLASFRCHMVPSAKSTSSLYEDLLQPLLKEVAASAINPYLADIRSALDGVSGSLNSELTSVGLGDLSVNFGFDESTPSQLLRGFDLELSDPQKTPIWEKGQGIQSTALFASFLWISKQEQALGLVPIWLIEEPESYLHPELSKACKELLDALAQEALVILTTHSLSFVPPSVRQVQGVSLDAQSHTVVDEFVNHAEATKRIRESLGVQFADYYNLAATNLFVEGPSDKKLIEWVLEVLVDGETRFPNLSAALIEDFGGVTQLEGFLKAVFAPIRGERALVSLFDGDDAGQKSRRALQGYFANKQVPFDANKHYVSVRHGYAVEGLFPDTWLVELHEKFPTWFLEYSVDPFGVVEPFRFRDDKKSNAQEWFMAQQKLEAEGDETWAIRWLVVMDALEEALVRQLDELGGA